MKTKSCLTTADLGAGRKLLLAVVLCLTIGIAAAANPGKGKGNDRDKDNDDKAHGKAKGQSEDFVPPGHRRAPQEYVVKSAPPALRVEVMSARPAPAQVWVRGYWLWQPDVYVWTPGMWILPPEPAAVWVEPRFETRSSASIFISGYWRL